MRVWLVAALCLAGCKDKPAKQASPAPNEPNDPHAGLRGDAGAPPPELDWAPCEAAVAKAEAAPPAARPQILIDGCRVCGDWTPILRWNTLAEAGGPKRVEIEGAMLGCNAFCNGEAKMKFLGTLDDARGTSSRMPWKQLAIQCTDKVSAKPDGRFVDAPYFALDRIARTVGARRPELAPRLAALEVTLPALSIVGTGAPLPVLETGTSATVADVLVSVLASTITVTTPPRAHLTKDGIAVDIGANGYPGKPVAPNELAASLAQLAGGTKSKTVMIIAPSATPAQALVPIVATASAVMTTYLAAQAPDSPEGWQLPGTIPIALEAGGANPIHVKPDMTVQQLAETLAAQLARNVNRIGIAAP